MRNTPRLHVFVLLPLLFSIFQPSPPVEQYIIGAWQPIYGFPMYYEFKRDHTITTRYTYAKDEPLEGATTPEKEESTGKWAVNSDGTLLITFANVNPMTATLRSSLMLISMSWRLDDLMILQKLDTSLKPMPYKPGPTAIRPPIFDVSKVRGVTVYERWTVYSPITPIEATYALTRSGGALSGTALFTTGGHSPMTQTASIHLGASATNTFLRRLASTPVETGRYTPSIVVPDSYPSIVMTVTLPSEVVVFRSKSQGQHYVPWASQIKGKQYVVFSDTIGASWQTLDASLARDIQTQLIKTAEGWR
jgi:hypothetical protein